MSEYSESSEIGAEFAMETVGKDSTDGEDTTWHRLVAFTTLVLAILAALSALLAGVSSGQILTDRTEEIIDLSQVLSDQLRLEVLQAKHQLLAAAGIPIPPEDISPRSRQSKRQRESRKKQRKPPGMQPLQRKAPTWFLPSRQLSSPCRLQSLVWR